jgi:hypothetical protein
MQIEKSDRGFKNITHPIYADDKGNVSRIITESSAINFDYEDGLDIPGSSYLWFGEEHHLNREEVTVLRDALNNWLEHKRLPDNL